MRTTAYLLLVFVTSNAYVVRRRDPFDDQESMRDALEALESRRLGDGGQYYDAASQGVPYDEFDDGEGYENTDPYLLQNLLDDSRLGQGDESYGGDEEFDPYPPFESPSYDDGAMSPTNSDDFVGIKQGAPRDEPVTREELEDLFKSVNDQYQDQDQDHDSAQPLKLSLKKKYQPSPKQFKNSNSLTDTKTRLKNMNPQQMQALLDELRAEASREEKRNTAKKSTSGGDSLQKVNQEELNSIFGSAGIKKSVKKEAKEDVPSNEEMTKKRKRSGTDGLNSRNQNSGTDDVIGDASTKNGDDLDFRKLYQQTDLKANLLQRENEYLTDALDLATLSQLKGGNDLVPKEADNLQKAMEIESLIGRLERNMVQQIGVDLHADGEHQDENDEEKKSNLEDLGEEGYLRGVEDKRQSSPENAYNDIDEKLFQMPRPADDDEDMNTAYIPDGPIYADLAPTCPLVDKIANGCQILQDVGVVLDLEAATLCDRHLVCYACGAAVGGSRDSCDQGFLAAAERACRDSEECKEGATSVLLALQKLHAFNLNKLNACRAPCVMDFVVNGEY
ncbi:uncharacterized protein LOC106179439 [Lingula anatina]|uniref:Uncharacterized protein LOC106179439 n=1 Tax=Lingula anatina TaxID=7574 RepID=A0A1S3K7A8_LINAN|nr:uncharacterized protein LOC106179439 [Lingula anatina]|eukprot:XP_013418513.1 uncharacterized protein LOC106179439 [Lingula anatina]